MNAETFCEHFATFGDAPNGIAKLRAMILQLAVQGKLVPQDEKDGSADELVAKIETQSRKSLSSRELKSLTQRCTIDHENAPFVIPTSWIWVPLGSIAVIETGKRMKGGAITSGVISLGGEHLQPDGTVTYSIPRYVSEEFFDAMPSGHVRENDCLMVKDGATTGKTAFVSSMPLDGKAAINEHVFIIRGLEPLNKRLLFQFVRAISQSLITSKSQGIIGGVGREVVLNATFPLPPLAEQRRIVEKVDQLLGLCDELAARQAAQREKRQRLVEATLDRLVSTRNPAEFPTHAHRLRNHFDQLFDTPTTIPQLRQTILQLAVQGQLVPQDPDDEPIHQALGKVIARRAEAVRNKSARRKEFDGATDLIKADSLPESWAVERLGNLVDPESTISYGVLVPGNDVADGVPFVRVQDLSLDSHAARPNKTISRDIEKAYSRTRLRGGEILICVVGATIGRLGIVPETWAGANIARAVVRIQPVPEISYEYLLLILQTPLIKDYFRETTRTLAQPTLNVGAIEQTPVPLPPLAEQKRIVTKVTELLSLCDALEAKLTQAESASTQLLSAAIKDLLSKSGVQSC